MISKELLGAITNAAVDDIDIDGNTVSYTMTRKYSEEINIYELMHLCKRWALKHEYQLHSALRTDAYPICVLVSEVNNIKMNFKADTEAEAIFKACEYILDKEEK